MVNDKILKHYVSPVDQFIYKFDAQNPELSLSQKLEKNKFKRIYSLRDNADQGVASKLPEDF